VQKSTPSLLPMARKAIIISSRPGDGDQSVLYLSQASVLLTQEIGLRSPAKI